MAGGSIGSVTVDVVPDASGFAEKLKAKLANLNVKVGVELDDKKVKAQLAALAKKHKQVKVGVDLDSRGFGEKIRGLIRPRVVTINADVKDQIAKARLDALTGRERRASVKADLDAKVAAAKLAKLTAPRIAPIRASVSGGNSLDSMSGRLGLIAKSALLIGPALIPATAAVVGLAGALAAPALAAGGAAGIFGAVAVGAIAKAKKDADAIAALVKKANSATKPADARKFQAQADALRNGLPKAEQAFLKAKGSISRGFDELLNKSGGNVFGPLAAGATLIGRVLPKLSPVIDAVGGAITGMIGSVSKWTDGNGFKGLVDFLAGPGTAAFKSFVDIAGGVAVGVGGMVKAFTPLGTSVLGGLTRMTDKFAEFGRGASSNSGFQAFIAYVRKVGPTVGRTLGHVAQAVGHVVAALAPQGGVMLGVLDKLATSVAKLSPGQIAAVAGAVGALGLATGKFSALTGLTLLVSAISYAYSHSSAFHDLADGAGKFAGAINSLPKGIKIGLGGAAALGALALKLKGGGGVAGLLPKVLGGKGGVQPVFVTNPGFGLPGKGIPGGIPPVVAGPAAKGGALAKGAGGLAAALGLAKGAAPFLFGSSPNTFTPGNVGPVLPFGLGGGKKRSAPTEVTNPTVLAEVKSKGIAQYNKDIATAKRGQDAFNSSLAPASRLFTKNASGAVRAAEGTRTLSSSLRPASQSFTRSAAASIAFNGAMRRSGITAHEYGRRLQALPPAVRTKVSAPGALSSKSQVEQLTRKYNLTPKQKKTLMALVGANKAAADATNVKHKIEAVPKSKKPKVDINTSGLGPLHAGAAGIAALHNKSVTTTITTNHITHFSSSGNSSPRGVPGPASGNTNPLGFKRKRAAGGSIFGPGTGTSDSIPVWLSNGEEVINARQATRHRALLKAINSGTQGFAAGGTVGGGAVTGGGGRVALTITNWQTGEGYMTDIADSRVTGHGQLAARIGRQG